MNLVDISIVSKRKAGERRKSGIGYNKDPKPIVVDVWSSYLTATNHLKHSDLIYREAQGGFEKRGKPRNHPDWFE